MNEENYTIYNGDCFKVMEELIANSIKIDAIICDPPYNIDGTTGRAALNLGRKFIGIEKDTEWFNLAKSRLSEKPIIQNTDDIVEDYDF